MSTIVLKINLLAAGEQVRLLRPLKAEVLHERAAHSSAGNVGQWRHLLAEMTSSETEENNTFWWGL